MGLGSAWCARGPPSKGPRLQPWAGPASFLKNGSGLIFAGVPVPKRLIFAGVRTEVAYLRENRPKRLIFACSVPEAAYLRFFFLFWEPQRSVPKRLIFARTVRSGL
eukprot:3960882-Prymnesium_polylepis.1